MFSQQVAGCGALALVIICFGAFYLRPACAPQAASVSVLNAVDAQPATQSDAAALAVVEYDAAYRSSLPGRIATAVELAVELARAGAREELICKKSQALGPRPDFHAPAYVGTACESWIHRLMVTTLSHLLDSSMVGLEWSSGSSTIWLLRRMGRLYSCEHNGPWVINTDRVITAEMPWRRAAWHFQHVECPTVGTAPCPEYVSYPTQHYKASVPNGFDFVSVDGIERTACMLETLRSGLLRPKYGLLMLDNANRAQYAAGMAAVPKHWVVVSFTNPDHQELETTLWMACPKDDAWCQRSQREINGFMQHIPAMRGQNWQQQFVEQGASN